MIVVIDYGMGNLFSIYNAFVHINASPKIISEPLMLSGSDGIVIPGVGAFGKCMERLSPFEVALLDEFRNGTPILGICIGQQVLFQRSQESPGVKGLGWIKGEVVKLPNGIMIPQMGWNSICIKRNSEILEGLADGDMFYFVHSFHCVPDDGSVIAATTEYGAEVTAAISRDNLSATQFHPEKSGEKGLKILENFVRSTRC